MAEIKNSFLKSKMNKDLDDRLIPNGEYRDANNISVGKSEDDDIGALENVKGNTLVPGTNVGALEVIGYLKDNNSETIYLFLTDNVNDHRIYKYFNNSYTKIVEGAFLNFNNQNLISGINLVEDLLFFTDNRNQPRKINVNKPLGYYTKENQISVAKYNPYEPLELLKSTTSVAGAASASTTITLSAANTAITKGMNVIGPSITADQYIYVTNVSGVTITINAAATVANLDVLTFLTTTMTGKDITYDFNGGADWPGDPDFLEDLFVRFSYRFKFDDQEYSLMAPFTQPAFIPQQKGYFLEGDEDAAYRSTILRFMQNGVQNVELIIPLPDAQNKLGAQASDTYKITEIDILYKESDGRAVKVLDTVKTDNLSSSSNIYTYDYQSRKPYKTLPERQTVRVYDRVPVKALSQEIAGNRVMYGNFQSQHTPPATLDYNVGASAKNSTVFTNWAEYPNHTLKQNRNYQVGFILADKFGRQSSVILSSVDQGTTVGSDFFGGSTFYHPYSSTTQNLKQWFGDALKVVINTAISSTADSTTGTPGLYAEAIGNGYVTAVTNPTLNVAVNPIPGTSLAGYQYNPIWAQIVQTNSGGASIGVGVTVTFGSTTGVVVGDAMITGATSTTDTIIYGKVTKVVNATTVEADIYIDIITGTQITFITSNAPFINTYLRGENTDFVKVYKTTGANVLYVYTLEPINTALYSSTINNPDIKFAYTLPNPLGWYSYKVVVKQQEQDYYNCYLPGFLNGYPDHGGTSPYPTNEDNKTAHVVLLNDNINKIPRDLNETSDQQKQFRSSVRLYGRVNNTATDNVQYFPVSTSGTQILPLNMTADTIATAADLNMDFAELSNAGKDNFYQLDTNPLISRLATSNAGTTNVGVLTAGLTTPFLSIAETEPVESLLQLFYETSTAGLIADLNADINTGFDGVAALSALSYSHNEDMAANTDITAVFYPQNNQGSNFSNANISAVSMTVVDGAQQTRATGNLVDGFTGDFKLITSGTGYKLQTAVNTFVYSNAGYENNGDSKETYTFTFTWTTVGGDTSSTIATGSLTNLAPVFVAGSSLPNVTVSAGDATGVTRNGYNGSATNSAAQLKYSIVSQSPGSYFSVDPATGVVTKATSTPIGVYTLNLKIEDAIVSGVAQSNSLSVTKPQIITVGAVAVNNGVISGCKTIGSPNLAATGQITAPVNGSVVTGVWYLSDTTLTSFPVTPSTNTTESNFVHRLGSAALSAGTLVLSCNMQQSFTNTGGGMSFVTSGIIWKVWHRNPSVTSNWAMIEDVNNNNMGATGVTASLLNNSFGSTKYTQAVFAFNEPGEYVIAATDANTTQAAVAADAMCAWVNSNDLYYSTCVVENGSNVTDNSTPKNYKYDISGAQTAYNCATGNTPRYAPMPYAQYVDLLYTTSSLNSPWTHSQAEYYSFKTSAAGSEPFTSIRVSAKFGTNGIKISPALIPDACNDQYARACQAGNITCAHPILGGNGW